MFLLMMIENLKNYQKYPKLKNGRRALNTTNTLRVDILKSRGSDPKNLFCCCITGNKNTHGWFISLKIVRFTNCGKVPKRRNAQVYKISLPLHLVLGFWLCVTSTASCGTKIEASCLYFYKSHLCFLLLRQIKLTAVKKTLITSLFIHVSKEPWSCQQVSKPPGVLRNGSPVDEDNKENKYQELGNQTISV